MSNGTLSVDIIVRFFICSCCLGSIQHRKLYSRLISQVQQETQVRDTWIKLQTTVLTRAVSARTEVLRVLE